MRRFALAVAFFLFATGAFAQGCGPTNPNCTVPDRPLGDSTFSAANTRFVQQAVVGGVISISQGAGIIASPNPITGVGTISASFAANSDVWVGTTSKILDAHVAQTSIAPQTVAISVATFTPDFSTGINIEMTLVHASCPCTIASPVNVYAGLSGFMTIIQSATGSDTIGTWGTNWKFAGGNKPTLSTAANAIDTLGFYCRTTTFCEVTLHGTGFQ